jgi:hypothetical protein
MHENPAKFKTEDTTITVTINLPINLLESTANAFDNYVRNQYFEQFKSDFIDNAYKVRHEYLKGEIL